MHILLQLPSHFLTTNRVLNYQVRNLHPQGTRDHLNILYHMAVSSSAMTSPESNSPPETNTSEFGSPHEVNE